MGRKRNQGKARRAAKAKAKAKEEAERRESNNQVITDGPLQIGESEKCSHGLSYDSSNDFCFQSLRAFNSSFDVVRSGDRSLSDCLLHAENATMDQFADFWSDSTKMERAILILLYTGTAALIKGEDDVARDAATFVRFFEQYIAVELKQSQAIIDWPKICDVYQADLHTLVSYFRHRIPCSCLDEKYEEVKHITKLGVCYNSQCSIPDKRVERSKTKYCSRCRSATYCSRECQVAAWSRHKPYCDKFAEIIAEFQAEQDTM
jgi:hypothetical protein